MLPECFGGRTGQQKRDDHRFFLGHAAMIGRLHVNTLDDDRGTLFDGALDHRVNGCLEPAHRALYPSTVGAILRDYCIISPFPPVRECDTAIR